MTQPSASPTSSKVNVIEWYQANLGRQGWMICHRGHRAYMTVPYPRELMGVKERDSKFFRCWNCKKAKSVGIKQVHPEVTGVLEAVDRLTGEASEMTQEQVRRLFNSEYVKEWRAALALGRIMYDRAR